MESWIAQKLREQSGLKEKSVGNFFKDEIRLGHEQYLKKEYYDYYLHHDESLDLQPVTFSAKSSYVIKHNCEKNGKSFSELFSLNSSGLRSDEFTSDHKDKMHVLFAGCSNTFGDGLPLEFIWAKKVHESISEQSQTSGYFNIAFPGASMLFITMQIFKYVDLYGTPDLLFVMLPDAEREMLSEVGGSRLQGMVSQIYRIMLRQLKKGGCRVIAISWDARANLDYRGKQQIQQHDPRISIDTDFYQFDNQAREIHLWQASKKDNSGLGIYEEFLITAMDEQHPGIAEHEFYHNFIMDIYNGNVEASSPIFTGKYEETRPIIGV
jgi:hypothetical protein